MEFTLQSDNVQVTLKEDKQRYDGYNSRVEEDAKDENKIIHNNTKSNIIPQKEILDSSGNKLIRFEILLKLEDYYLINNIRLKGEIEDISIKKIKFQNVNTGLWESVSFFNPDNKETFVKEKDSISIFSVGLTQYIKLELVIKCNSELFVNKTSDRETSPLRIMKNMNGDDINKLVVGSNHNSSMHEINRNAAFKLNNEKKKIFNLNVDYSSAKNNSNNHNLSNDKISSRSRSNTGCHNITEDNINILNHRALPKDPDYSTICNKLINDKIQKIIIYSQYLYTIPNSTFLLTLLNLKNFFKNNIKNEKIMIKNKISSSSNNENYLSSLFLTATSMIQARQFIQAWELVHNLQIYLIKNTDTNNSVFFKILLEPNNVQNGNHMLLSLSSEQNEAPSRTPIFLTKLEIIKTVCIYEYGHILAFLDSLRNLVNIYFLNDYSHISYNFSWAKNNEIASDRNFIQNFLIENGKNLGEILITMINDQTEIVTVSALKIIEFILDHNPTVLIPYYSKILKYLLAFLYPRGSTENSKCLSLKNLPNINSDNQVAYCNYLKDFDDKKIFFPLDFFFTFVNQFDKTNKENEIAENERVKKEKQKDSTSSSFNNMSTFLLKQVNYTLDTLIDTLETLPQIEIIGIITKINNILFNILKNNESENVTAINITKIIKKLYDNLNTSILEIFFKSKKNGYIHNISGSNPYIIPEYIFILLVSNLNSNTKLFNKFRDFTNPQQVKNYNKNFTFFKPEMTLLDNSEIGGLISFMFEKISDECFLFSEREFSINLINWLSSNLEIITNHLNSNVPVPGDNNKTYLEEFSIFYAYHLLFLLNNLFFSKSEIKHGLSRIFITKMHPESINYLSKLITILIKFEEVCLGNKKCLILFEPTIEILKKIRGNYSSLFNVDYSSFFVDQYEKLYSFMSKTGIFNENIFYMIKTIEFININSDNLSSGDYRAQTVLQNIFTLVLQNFSIYYSDDMVELFNSLIYILRDNMNEKMISDIIIAIINKYNYKGQNFTLCCSKFFQVIIKSETSFQFMKNVLLKGIDKYNENLVKNAGDIFKFKESHLEFLEKFEIYMKYLEFLKSESYLEMCLKNSNYEDFNLRHDNLLFSDVESFNCFLKLSKTSNETVCIKKLIIEFRFFLRFMKSSSKIFYYWKILLRFY